MKFHQVLLLLSEFETLRQISILESGGQVLNETRAYDVETGFVNFVSFIFVRSFTMDFFYANMCSVPAFLQIIDATSELSK